jgi:small-conductance mechanosensitive channel
MIGAARIIGLGTALAVGAWLPMRREPLHEGKSYVLKLSRPLSGMDHHPYPIGRWVGFLVLFIWLFILVVPSMAAQEASEPLSLDAMRAQLTKQEAVLADEPDDAALARARDTAVSIQSQAEDLATRQQPKLASLDARLAELGAAPEDPSLESDEVRGQRVTLSDQRSAIDAEIRQARLLSVQAAQLVDRVSSIRQEKFQAALYQRAAPPYSPAFWSGLIESRVFDASRLERFEKEVRTALAAAMAPKARVRFIGLVLLAGMLLVAARWWGGRHLRRRTVESMPPGRLRRSALILGRTLAVTLSVWISARLVYEGLDWSLALPERVRDVARYCVGLVSFCALVASFGRALLSCDPAFWQGGLGVIEGMIAELEGLDQFA